MTEMVILLRDPISLVFYELEDLKDTTNGSLIKLELRRGKGKSSVFFSLFFFDLFFVHF